MGSSRGGCRFGADEANAVDAGRMLKGGEVLGGCYLVPCPTEAVLRVCFSRGVRILGVL